ncbi:glycosyltransferase family 4 protein [Bizionia myxarmorum]|uniref:Glycosyltransferase family 4 protein n=1 Tax=Bizionia myxarmorum TaxID=291186 RepID=A0A5D0R665_9FLAO|nr:glycosyltransferase family 4 protein [Bizionia myxarmorum]TYB77007.1 glycosyltransferase family 4 protein [Bizionia myxarmorum]
MKKPLRIAIYSGTIPSTTFIERLIVGLSNKEQKVLLFGISTRAARYSQFVSVICYKSNRFSKAIHLLKYTLLLLLFNIKEKRILDALLQSQNRSTWNDKLKTYPVLYHKPDVFHIQWAKGLNDWVWVQDFGMKLVLSLRGAHINYSPIADLELAVMYRQNFPKVDGFHAVCQEIAIEAVKYGAKKETIHVVKSGLNLQELAFKLKEFDSNTPLNIISVGRDHWIKDYRLALDAMYILKQKGIFFRYNIIGVSENEGLVFQRAQLGLENEVHFIDSMTFNAVQEAMNQADVFFLPSLKEGIANVVLEAMALGTIVVSSDCGGMAEVVKPNDTGFLVPVRDVESMTLALVAVSQLSKEDYQEMTKRARRFVEQNHSEEQMVEGMLDLYQGLG